MSATNSCPYLADIHATVRVNEEEHMSTVKSKSLKLSNCKVCFIRDRGKKRNEWLKGVILIILAFVKNKFLVALNLQ
jgi:hypothetical protein